MREKIGRFEEIIIEIVQNEGLWFKKIKEWIKVSGSMRHIK